MLHTIKPVAFINRAIVPKHFPEAVSNIIKVVAAVNISSVPLKNTIAMLLIVFKLTFVLIAIQRLVLFPLALAFLYSVNEVPYVACTVAPFVNAFSIWLALFVQACKLVAISKNVSSLAVL